VNEEGADAAMLERVGVEAAAYARQQAQTQALADAYAE